MRIEGVRNRAIVSETSALIAAAETAVLLTVGPAGSAALGPQISAPPPFDLFHDLRWVSVYHRSWIDLAAAALLIIVFRSAYVAWMVHKAWPRDDPPALWGAFWRVFAFHAAAILLIAPWTAFFFGLALTDRKSVV